MSVDLTTTYLGMKLRNPIGIAACPPLTGRIDTLCELEEAGASIAVLPSLFEEQIEHEEMQLTQLYEYTADTYAESLSHFPELEDYNTGPREYLKRIEQAKAAVTIPIVASLNGKSIGGWTRYARMMQDAGADAIELNIYYVPTDASLSAGDVEQQYIDLVAEVRQHVTVPLAIKVGQNFTALPNFAQSLASAGADGLVLFNRYLESDIDLDALQYRPDLVLSNRHEARTPIRWIAILRDQLPISLAATSGIHRMQGVVKLLLAGADVTLVASILLMKGPKFVATLLEDVRSWIIEREYVSVEQLKGSMSRDNSPNPGALERANYMKALTDFTSRYPM